MTSDRKGLARLETGARLYARMQLIASATFRFAYNAGVKSIYPISRSRFPRSFRTLGFCRKPFQCSQSRIAIWPDRCLLNFRLYGTLVSGWQRAGQIPIEKRSLKMRFPLTFFALALCAASLTTAQAQNATLAPPHPR